jgi:hypothetical protein
MMKSIGETPHNKSFGEKAWEMAAALFTGTVEVTVDVMAERIIPQGAAEIASGLFSHSNSYVPYGYSQQPLEAGIHGVEVPQQDLDRGIEI